MRKKLDHEESFSRLRELFVKYYNKIDLLSLLTENDVIKEASRQVSINCLFDLPGEKRVHVPMSFEQIFHYDFFKDLDNIIEFLQKLHLSIRFLGNLPSGRKFIEKNEYIKYHIEFFFHNLFAIEDRLSELYTRTYKETSVFKETADKEIRKKVKKFFKKHLPMRYRHDIVHNFYSYDDEKLSQLNGLELLSKAAPPTKMSEIYREMMHCVTPEIREEKVQYCDKILTDLINFVVECLFESNIFFNSELNLQIPQFETISN